jgi:hypothetical protein
VYKLEISAEGRFVSLTLKKPADVFHAWPVEYVSPITWCFRQQQDVQNIRESLKGEQATKCEANN